MNDRHCHPAIARTLLLGTGILLITLAGLYNEFLAGWLDPNPPLKTVTAEKIRWVQICFLSVGITFLGVSECLKRIRWLGVIFESKAATGFLLSLLFLFLPLFISELLLQPFAKFENSRTSIYVRYPDLGWKLKPNSADMLPTLDHLFFIRPVPRWAKYRTWIKNLYLCAAGAYPGGGVMGASGRLAALEILKDWKSRKI